MLDVRKLLLLRELSHRGTIAAVADALAYTPSAVSQQLSALEREAGVPLLLRTGRGVTLTPAGAQLAEHTEPVLAGLERASAALAATRTELTGQLRIGAFPTAMRTILPLALVSLGREHPALELTVRELDPSSVADALRTDLLDLALINEYDSVPAEPDAALETLPLLEETMYLAATEPTRIAACRDASWILASPDTLCHTMAVRACEATGFTPRARHHADDFATVLALVAAGQGVALVPELGAVDPPAGVVLTALESRRRTLIAYRRGMGAHPAVLAAVLALGAAAPKLIDPKLINPG
jgi:DNA-binding transcriptional LysR family regulator